MIKCGTICAFFYVEIHLCVDEGPYISLLCPLGRYVFVDFVCPPLNHWKPSEQVLSETVWSVMECWRRKITRTNTHIWASTLLAFNISIEKKNLWNRTKLLKTHPKIPKKQIRGRRHKKLFLISSWKFMEICTCVCFRGKKLLLKKTKLFNYVIFYKKHDNRKCRHHCRK